MVFKTAKTALTERDIEMAIQANAPDAERQRRLKRYYTGKHIILNKQPRANSTVNNRIVNNFAKYITDFSTGYFIGNPATYKSNIDITDLTAIFKYNDEQAHNLNLAAEMSICGSGFEVLYIDGDSEVRFAAVPSDEMILIADATLEENIVAAIRHFKIKGFDGIFNEYVDVYDKDKVVHYSHNGGLKKIDEEAHYFNDVPVVEYPNNAERRGDFEDVISLIDAYNLATSLSLDDAEDFTNAFLMLKNFGGTTAVDIEELRRRKVIMLDEGGDAQWLIKNLNDSYLENIKTRLENDIHKFSGVPDMSDDNFAGNASGVAIKYKLIGLEQIRTRKERAFKKGLQRRIELISNILELKSKAAVDFRAVEIQFTPNIPANLLEQSQIVSQLQGLVSQKTLLSLLPFVTDPDEELTTFDKEMGRDNESTNIDAHNISWDKI